MKQNGSCATCGGPMKQGANGGICERCLLQAALRSEEQEIKQEVLQIPSAAERVAYVEEACRDDPDLRKRILVWLKDLQNHSAASLEESSLPADIEPRAINGRYRLMQKIGEGGFGTVYLAQQMSPIQRQVAIKILKLGMDTRQVVARFELERQTLALMDHPNIAKVFDAGVTESGRPYFVMELVRGVPITRYCQKRQLSVRQRLALFVEVCQAVQHAHQKGIIHRDLKPSNILVGVKEGSQTPKVIDFGIARAAQEELTEHTRITWENHLLGTPAYISPEQASLANGDIDTRSDIYSLGVLLYELLTGATPFDTKELTQAGLDEMRRVIREKEPLRPSIRLGQTERDQPGPGQSRFKSHKPKIRLDRDVDWIVLKCLRKDRALRYATANGLAMDIQRYLNHEPIVARPPSMFYRASKLVRRNPVVTSLCALLVLGLVLAVVASTSMGLRIARAKREADQANRQLSKALRFLESEKMEELAAEGRRARPLAWLASHMRQNPMDPVAASRALSMLTLHNFALPAAVPMAHRGPVNSAQFSPDGTQILSASDDHTVRFWEAATGRALVVMTNAAPVLNADYAARGTRIVVTTRDNVAQIYDTWNRTMLFQVQRLHRDLLEIVNAPGSPRLYAAHPDHTVSCWDLQSGQELGPRVLVSGNIVLMETSEPADCLAVVCDDQTVHLFQASTGQRLVPARQFDFPVRNLRFTPDGNRIFLALQEGRRVAIWPFRSIDTISEFVPPDGITMQYMAFTPDGSRLATAAWGAPVHLWDSTSLKLLHEPAGAETQGWAVYSFSHDGSRMAGIAQTGTAHIWDSETGQTVIEPFEHRGWIHSLVFSSDDSQVLTASQDGTARLWDVRMRPPPAVSLPTSVGGGDATFDRSGTRLVVSIDRDAVQVCDARTGRPVSPILQHPWGQDMGHIRGATFSGDDTMLLTTGEKGLVRVWDAASFRLKRELTLKRDLVTARFAPDSQSIVIGDRNGYATIWSTVSGSQLGTAAAGSGEVISLDFQPHGSAFVTATINGTARCWSLPTGEPVSAPMRHQGIVWSAAYSPDGGRVVTASADGTAQIWDAQTGHPLLKPMQHEKDVLSACFSPDGKWVLTTSEDGTARVWDAATGAPVSPVLRHSAKVWMGAFSTDSRWVATGSDDRTVRLWDPLSGLPVSEPLPHTGPLGRLQFSPDGRRLLTFGGQPKIWDVIVAPTPVPSWFCDVVEAVAGLRLLSDGGFESVSPQAIDTLRKRFAAGKEEDFYSRWTKWFLVDRLHDPVPPCPAE